MWLTLFFYVTVSGCFAFKTTKINLSFQRRKIHVPNASYLRLERRELMMVVEDDVAAVENQWDPKAGPKLDFNEDYYSILEVESTVSPKELKKVKKNYHFLQSCCFRHKTDHCFLLSTFTLRQLGIFQDCLHSSS